MEEGFEISPGLVRLTQSYFLSLHPPISDGEGAKSVRVLDGWHSEVLIDLDGKLGKHKIYSPCNKPSLFTVSGLSAEQKDCWAWQHLTVKEEGPSCLLPGG